MQVTVCGKVIVITGAARRLGRALVLDLDVASLRRVIDVNLVGCCPAPCSRSVPSPAEAARTRLRVW